MKADIPRQEYRGKRVVDLVLVLVSAPAWAPVLGACALWVRLDSPGPILFRQKRVGRGGAPFEILKFRSMIDDRSGNPVFPDKRRVTRPGRFLRRWSLDELPQVVNVLRGEMSVVGPRPTLEYQVERYDDRQRRRLATRPGLTGLAQLKGRNAIPWTERIEWDLRYIDEQSALTDLRLIALTPFTVMSGRGLGGHPTDDPVATPR